MIEPWHRPLAGHAEGVSVLASYLDGIREKTTALLVEFGRLERDLPTVWRSESAKAFLAKMQGLPKSLDALRSAHASAGDTLQWCSSEMRTCAAEMGGVRHRGEAAAADLLQVNAEFAQHVETMRSQQTFDLGPLTPVAWPPALAGRRTDALSRRTRARTDADALHQRNARVLGIAQHKLDEMRSLAYQDSPLLSFLDSVPIFGEQSAAWLSDSSNRDLIHYANDHLAAGLAAIALVATPIPPLAAALHGASKAVAIGGAVFRVLDVGMEVDPTRRDDRARAMAVGLAFAGGTRLASALGKRLLSLASPRSSLNLVPKTLRKALADKGLRFHWHGHDISLDGRHKVLSRPLDAVERALHKTHHISEAHIDQLRRDLLRAAQAVPDVVTERVESFVQERVDDPVKNWIEERLDESPRR